MHKEEFSKHIAQQHNITQKAAHDVIDTFTSSVIDAMGQSKEISLVGFGNFSIGKVAARTGRNPKTQEPLQIPAYNQPKFKAGQKLKDVVNKK
ncbi:HU family DNA-binding protein (plasmid) [Candidatus Megaera polyxenophila]|uniref:HU family DNA-binding protein n=1 Tax=Candidatus Megaera polyxenophila TaxID=988779 RepID=UPI00249F24F4|nr:HU family DNA-binding protein [Candidatus Megaera polyxenophila]